MPLKEKAVELKKTETGGCTTECSVASIDTEDKVI